MSADVLPCAISPLPEAGEREPLPESLTRYTGFLISKAHQRLFHLFGEECRKAGLDVPHPGILHLLRDEGAMSQQQLGRRLRVDRTSMVKLVDALEERKFARRSNHPEDRRAYLVEITPAGRKALEKISEIAERMEQELLAPFSEEERKVIRRALLTLAG